VNKIYYKIQLVCSLFCKLNIIYVFTENYIFWVYIFILAKQKKIIKYLLLVNIICGHKYINFEMDFIDINKKKIIIQMQKRNQKMIKPILIFFSYTYLYVYHFSFI
jgi:hypothetical protein